MQYLNGHFETKLDESFRFNVPAGIVKKIFNNTPPGLAFAIGEGCVKIYTDESWKVIMDKISSLNMFDEEVQEFVGKFLFGSEQTTIDKSGKLTIPNALRYILEGENDIIIYGAITHFEIWHKSKFDAKYGRNSERSLKDLTKSMIEKHGLSFK